MVEGWEPWTTMQCCSVFCVLGQAAGPLPVTTLLCHDAKMSKALPGNRRQPLAEKLPHPLHKLGACLA